MLSQNIPDFLQSPSIGNNECYDAEVEKFICFYGWYPPLFVVGVAITIFFECYSDIRWFPIFRRRWKWGFLSFGRDHHRIRVRWHYFLFNPYMCWVGEGKFKGIPWLVLNYPFWGISKIVYVAFFLLLKANWWPLWYYFRFRVWPFKVAQDPHMPRWEYSLNFGFHLFLGVHYIVFWERLILFAETSPSVYLFSVFILEFRNSPPCSTLQLGSFCWKLIYFEGIYCFKSFY